MIAVLSATGEEKKVPIGMFKDHELAGSVAGKLFLDLLKEDSWSNDFLVTVHFSSRHHMLCIRSPLLPKNNETGRNEILIVFRDDKPIMTVPDVANLLKPLIDIRSLDVDEELKALAAIKEQLPEQLRRMEECSAKAAVKDLCDVSMMNTSRDTDGHRWYLFPDLPNLSNTFFAVCGTNVFNPPAPVHVVTISADATRAAISEMLTGLRASRGNHS